MLERFKQFFSAGNKREAPVGNDWSAAERWAASRGASFKRSRDGTGFVVDATAANPPWRLEWGPSQREYIEGQELRLRRDLPLPAPLQVLLLSRALMHALETETFDRYTDHLKTQIDASTPEEMRWLVMYNKLSLRAVPALHVWVAAVGQSLPSVARWLEGPLAEALEAAGQRLLANAVPFVLMAGRNRVVLRMGLAEPQPRAFDDALELFQVAVARTASAVDGLALSEHPWAHTAASQWHSQLPGDKL